MRSSPPLNFAMTTIAVGTAASTFWRRSSLIEGKIGLVRGSHLVILRACDRMLEEFQHQRCRGQKFVSTKGAYRWLLLNSNLPQARRFRSADCSTRPAIAFLPHGPTLIEFRNGSAEHPGTKPSICNSKCASEAA